MVTVAMEGSINWAWLIPLIHPLEVWREDFEFEDNLDYTGKLCPKPCPQK